MRHFINPVPNIRQQPAMRQVYVALLLAALVAGSNPPAGATRADSVNLHNAARGNAQSFAQTRGAASNNLLARNSTAATQTDIVGPAGSGRFGSWVTVLSSGNIVVLDPDYDAPGPIFDVGAVYLYDGATGGMISKLTGSTTGDFGGTDVTLLTNGNYVVTNPVWDNAGAVDAGAVTWCSGTTGCAGIVSSTNSLVGGTARDGFSSDPHNPFFQSRTFVTPLPNGNYVASSPNWDNPSTTTDVGAVTWCNGTTGRQGLISTANSLVGWSTNDRVGGVGALTNGNYAVISPLWDNPNTATQNVGAVTLCSGPGGCIGNVSPANSLIGSTTNDQIGSSVTVLSNGNFVTRSQHWHDPANSGTEVGAVTWCSGATGFPGVVSATNSLIGGDSVTALQNGNFVVRSSLTNPATGTVNRGAVTLCNGTTGCSGAVSSSNSLIGSTNGDGVGSDMIELPSGDYVVQSPGWHDLANSGANVGAVTWCSGATGCTGPVSSANSLVGTMAGDRVGDFKSVKALTNGNYVVTSSDWSNPNGTAAHAGAVTLCNGAGGCVGFVSAANSLIGSSGDDRIGEYILTVPLTNGNYVVFSPFWNNPATGVLDVGAVTLCSGAGGCVGSVSAANSLVGTIPDDLQVNWSGVIALKNGNYVVQAQRWSNPSTGTSNVGAITWCNGVSGCTGPISSANSLVGSTQNERAGGGILPLPNGSYVVVSFNWNTNVGAVTWCNGAGGCTGAVSPSNSLVGNISGDYVGYDSVVVLPNGNYAVRSRYWQNPAGGEGAVTYGAQNGGTVGAITAGNSVLGTAPGGGFNLVQAFDSVNEQLVVGRPASNTLTLFRPTFSAIADGNWNAATTWDYGAFTKTQSVAIPSPRNVTFNVSNANVKDLTLGTMLNLGANTLTIDCSGSIAGASNTQYIFGKLKKNYCGPESFTYPVGTNNAYSPVDTTVTSGTGALSVLAVQGPRAPLNANQSLQRYWTLSGSGLNLNLTFHYPPGDVRGNETNYKVIRVAGSSFTSFLGTTLNTTSPNDHSASVNGVSNFSDWTVGEIASEPAGNGDVEGRIVDGSGNAVAGTTVRVTGTQNRLTITDAQGNYKFSNVMTNGNYTVTPSRANYNFAPINRSFTHFGNNIDVGFTGSFAGNIANPVDTPEYFVRQNYLDFLGREPDEGGFGFWTNEISACGSDQTCILSKRTNVSAAFFLSIEFRQTGYLVERTYKAAYGRANGTSILGGTHQISVPIIRLNEFLPDTRAIGHDVVVNQTGWETVLENNKVVFTNEFVQRSRFTTAYPASLTPTQFVDALFANAGVTPSATDRNAAINEFQGGGNTADISSRARALRRVAENSVLAQQELNPAFVLMQYFGYLRRNPNDAPEPTLDYSGYDFWLTKLNQFGGNFQQADMVKAFIVSAEYRNRFSQ